MGIHSRVVVKSMGPGVTSRHSAMRSWTGDLNRNKVPFVSLSAKWKGGTRGGAWGSRQEGDALSAGNLNTIIKPTQRK